MAFDGVGFYSDGFALAGGPTDAPVASRRCGLDRFSPVGSPLCLSEFLQLVSLFLLLLCFAGCSIACSILLRFIFGTCPYCEGVVAYKGR